MCHAASIISVPFGRLWIFSIVSRQNCLQPSLNNLRRMRKTRMKTTTKDGEGGGHVTDL